MKSPHRESVELREIVRPSAIADFATLTKPRIGSMIFFAAVAGAWLAQHAAASLARSIEAGLYVALLGAGASAFNQVLERDTDRRMQRTADRPIPSGRVRARDALIFGAILVAAGTLGLALRFNALSALLGLATLVGYALIYTPMKRFSTINTVIGAVPGAMPPLIGYAALANSVEGWGFWLFALLFVWQFPHFMAIAWMWRDDYARAGLKMLPIQGGGRAGRQAVVYSLLLLPISILPALHGEAGALFAIVALAASLGYAAAAVAFALCECEKRARMLLLVSLAHLPLVLTAALVESLAQASHFAATR
jgi:protoheme IX farnesyltransferase